MSGGTLHPNSFHILDKHREFYALPSLPSLPIPFSSLSPSPSFLSLFLFLTLPPSFFPPPSLPLLKAMVETAVCTLCLPPLDASVCFVSRRCHTQLPALHGPLWSDFSLFQDQVLSLSLCSKHLATTAWQILLGYTGNTMVPKRGLGFYCNFGC